MIRAARSSDVHLEFDIAMRAAMVKEFGLSVRYIDWELVRYLPYCHRPIF